MITILIIFLAVASICDFHTWLNLGDKIEESRTDNGTVFIREDGIYRVESKPETFPVSSLSVGKPAPTITSFSHTEPMRGKRNKTRKQAKGRRIWDESEA